MNDCKFFSTFLLILAVYCSSIPASSALNLSVSSLYTSDIVLVESKSGNRSSGNKELRKEMTSKTQKNRDTFNFAQLEKIVSPLAKNLANLKGLVIKPVSSVQDVFVMLAPFIFLYWLIVRKLEQ